MCASNSRRGKTVDVNEVKLGPVGVAQPSYRDMWLVGTAAGGRQQTTDSRFLVLRVEGLIFVQSEEVDC